jgi:hypothetical protein
VRNEVHDFAPDFGIELSKAFDLRLNRFDDLLPSFGGDGAVGRLPTRTTLRFFATVVLPNLPTALLGRCFLALLFDLQLVFLFNHIPYRRRRLHSLALAMSFSESRSTIG